MSSLAIIVIIVLLAAFIYMWAKCQSLQKEVHSKENKENELKKLALVLQNINAYFLLIDKDFVVCDTNYYSLNRLPIQPFPPTQLPGPPFLQLHLRRP